MSPLWPVHLRDGDLELRPLQRRDRRAYESLRSRNRDWLRPWDAMDPRHGGEPPYGAVLRWSRDAGRTGRSLNLGIVDDGALVGQVSAGPIVHGPQSSATIGYWVDQAHAGRGIAPRACALLIDHCFTGLGLHRVEANVRPENAASIRVVEKLHLRDEGLRRSYIYVDGKWRDHRSFALTVEEAPGGFAGTRMLARLHQEFPASPGAS